MITITNLHKSFDKKNILNGINLNIEKRSSSVIIGRSGTGKSVLIKCILGLITPDEGSIEIGNNTIFNKGKFKPLNNIKVGMLFQGGALFLSLIHI